MAKLTPTDKDVLLVVDVQNDFCPGGALAVPEGDRIVPIANRLAERFSCVVLTQDWHPPNHLSFASSHAGKSPFDTVTVPYGEQILWPDHCVQGTAGARFHAGIEADRADLILRKGFRREIDSYSAFFENDRSTATGLAGYLRDRGFARIFLCGLALDFCVRYSAEDAVHCGFETTVIIDACGAIDTDGSLAAARKALSALTVGFVNSAEFFA